MKTIIAMLLLSISATAAADSNNDNSIAASYCGSLNNVKVAAKAGEVKDETVLTVLCKADVVPAIVIYSVQRSVDNYGYIVTVVTRRYKPCQAATIDGDPLRCFANIN